MTEQNLKWNNCFVNIITVLLGFLRLSYLKSKFLFHLPWSDLCKRMEQIIEWRDHNYHLREPGHLSKKKIFQKWPDFPLSRSDHVHLSDNLRKKEREVITSSITSRKVILRRINDSYKTISAVSRKTNVGWDCF